MKHVLLASTSLLLAVPALAEPVRTQTVALEAETVADGLENPWGLDFLPDGAALVTERPGRLRVVADGRLSEPVDGVPDVAARGQGGLLDVAVAPDFAASGLIFLSFSEPGDGDAGTAVVRARLVREGASARLEDVETIFSMNRKTGTNRHFGSRLVFAPDGTLFVTTGDRGDGPRAGFSGPCRRGLAHQRRRLHSRRQPVRRRWGRASRDLVEGPPQPAVGGARSRDGPARDGGARRARRR